jgi:hypothetical protein
LGPLHLQSSLIDDRSCHRLLDLPSKHERPCGSQHGRGQHDASSPNQSEEKDVIPTRRLTLTRARLEREGHDPAAICTAKGTVNQAHGLAQHGTRPLVCRILSHSPPRDPSRCTTCHCIHHSPTWIDHTWSREWYSAPASQHCHGMAAEHKGRQPTQNSS